MPPTDLVGLELSGIGHRYRDKTVLHDIDLSVAPGEFVSFLGPSGSASPRFCASSPASNNRRAARSNPPATGRAARCRG